MVDNADTPILQIEGVSKKYRLANGRSIAAIQNIDLVLHPGETLGIVGESGCGKSTLGKILMDLETPSSGQVLFEGAPWVSTTRRVTRRERSRIQMVFQDPFSSLNPHHTIRQIVSEPLEIHQIGTRADQRRKVDELLESVGMRGADGDKYPHEFSGGQRQRIAIARALSLTPKVLIADEPVSALDVSIQSQILNLLLQIREQYNMSLIFISHDLSVVRHISDRVAVMYFGNIVEMGETQRVLSHADHPYTQALLEAVPAFSRSNRLHVPAATGPIELPDPLNPPSGCAYRARCERAINACAQACPVLAPRWTHSGASDELACHLYPLRT